MSSAKHSPTPWRVGKNSQGWATHVEDAEGCEVASCWGSWGKDCTEPATTDAALIVEAVNEHAKMHEVAANLLRSRDAAIEDSNRLRDLVRRMMPCVKERAREWIGETDNPMGGSSGRMWREAASKEAARLSALLAEAKEAMGDRKLK